MRLPLNCRQGGQAKIENQHNMPTTKPAYTEEFKRDVLAYRASTTESQRQTASHFGISTATLRAWQRRKVPNRNCGACDARTARC